MRTGQIATILLSVALVFLTLGGPEAQAQKIRVEAGGGWAIPSSTVTMLGDVGEGEGTLVEVDPGSGPHAYGAFGLVWTLSDNFNLEGRIRVQQSQLRGDAGDFSDLRRCGGGQCEVSRDPDGQLRVATFEGQITLTSVGRINPYFLVGLGVVQTTVDGVRVTTSSGTDIQFSEVDVTDAGGDVGFGASTQVVGNLLVTAEIRATGSLPGAKENAVTTFPFSLGLRYTFGSE